MSSLSCLAVALLAGWDVTVFMNRVSRVRCSRRLTVAAIHRSRTSAHGLLSAGVVLARDPYVRFVCALVRENAGVVSEGPSPSSFLGSRCCSWRSFSILIVTVSGLESVLFPFAAFPIRLVRIAFINRVFRVLQARVTAAAMPITNFLS
jgi:hypothetical protein